MKLLTIIPARAGSKRVPDKNIKTLNGKPLIAWTIEAALQADTEMDILVSTDSPKIAAIAQSYGVEVPFLRPEQISGDQANVFDAIQYSLHTLADMGRSYEYIMLLQPSSPLREKKHIEKAWHFFHKRKASALISVSQLEIPASWCMPLDDSFSLQNFIAHKSPATGKRSQDLEPMYHLNGAIYLAQTDLLLKHQSFYMADEAVCAFPMNAWDGLDIDTPQDFALAEFYMARKKLKSTTQVLDDERVD